MSAQEEPANVGKVLSFLREWDRGDRTGRGRMLSWFLGRTHDQLELQFAQVARLFLARLPAWMEVSDPSETVRLIFDLRRCDLRPVLLSGLLTLLRPAKEEEQHEFQVPEESVVIQSSGSLPAFVQRAAAAKTIRILAEDSAEISHELLCLGVIQHLLYAAGNREHTDAQVQASLALKHYVCLYPSVEEHVRRVVGRNLFVVFMNKPETWCMSMDETQAEKLHTSKVSRAGGVLEEFLMLLTCFSEGLENKLHSQERPRKHHPEDDVDDGKKARLLQF